jgi:hypothetical protein
MGSPPVFDPNVNAAFGHGLSTQKEGEFSDQCLSRKSRLSARHARSVESARGLGGQRESKTEKESDRSMRKIRHGEDRIRQDEREQWAERLKSNASKSYKKIVACSDRPPKSAARASLFRGMIL